MISRPRALPPPLRFPLLVLLLSACALLAAPARAQQMGDAGKDEEPAFKEFRGVTIGTPMEEARKKLGNPTDKSDSQDFYVFSDDETAQIFYDQKKVSAVALVYTGGKNAPTARSVFGKEVAAKPDGSQYLRVHYPKVNYWVSYSRTAGDTPVTSVTMQRKQ